MKSFLGYAALGGVVGLANAKVLKWSPGDEKRWSPPQETLGFMPALGMNGILTEGTQAPAPTSPPVLPERALQARGTTDNTCGYIGGVRTNSMFCPTSQFCAYNSINSHIGCCDDTSTNGCNVWTTCLQSSEAKKFTTDNGLTLWCGFSNYPNCVTHIYADPTATGYTLLGCGVAAATDKIFISPLDASSTSSFSSSSSSASKETSSAATETTSSSGTRTGLGLPGATNDQPTPQASSSSSVPLGPIIGGAVGGVAALALIGFGIVFLVRSNNKRKANIAPATATATAASTIPPSNGPPTSPAGTTTHMSQQGGYYDPSGAGFAHLDPRASIAKPPYGYDQGLGNGNGNGISPPASPPPPAQSPGPMYNSLPAQGYPQQQQQQQYAQPGQYSPQQQPGQGYPYPQQQQQQPYQAYSPQQAQQPPPQQQFVHELPDQRGDGEPRELAG